MYWDRGRKAVYFFGHWIFGELFQGEGFPVVWKTLCDYDPWILALSILGALFVLVDAFARRGPRDSERAKDLAVVLAYAIPYLVLIGLYARTYQRFVIPLLPYLACFAAYGVARVVRAAGSRSNAVAHRWLAAVVLGALLTPQVFAAIALARVRRVEDTGTRAAHWIAERLDAETDRIVLQYPLELPLFSTPASLAESNGTLDDRKHPWHLYQRRLGDSPRSDTAWNLVQIPLETPALRDKFSADPVGCLRELHGTYAAIDVYDEGRRPLILDLVRPALQEIGERVARFIPYGDETGNNLPLSYQDDEFPEHAPTHWWWESLFARCAGPVVEIYKLR